MQQHRIAIEGWPGTVPFRTVDRLRTDELEYVLSLLKKGTLGLRRLSEDEYADMAARRAEQIAAGEIADEVPVKRRRDHKTRRDRRTNPRTLGKKAKGRGIRRGGRAAL